MRRDIMGTNKVKGEIKVIEANRPSKEEAAKIIGKLSEFLSKNWPNIDKKF